MAGTIQDAFSLSGRTVIVSGAGGGIGTAIAGGFAAAGARVACLDLTPPHDTVAAISAAEGEAIAIACDVTDAAQVGAAVGDVTARWGAIHGLVNGTSNDDPTGSILDLAPDEWSRLFAVQVTGTYLMSRAVLPHMIAAGGGSIVHIASQMGHVAAKGRPGYCAAKGALIQLAKAMALDHAEAGIRVNSLSPGAVETRRMLLRHGDLETARLYNAPKHALGRLGQPMEIATAALFLMSDASSFMTGADLLVDGGYAAM
ncbi:NAD(P)-dependent dehydrogenase (short-subunit alcohol dehydrogenase family) [Xanthobacter sp. SG618]|uniref:SDR family NAD(P)-dependent oxidoreductase n=1 Tax=Xanthobacter sp. SG618 TaxID=2587121 RepID=UPI00145DA0C8|nr:SDR family oxidoreductase [Xanthobacter sp. SG618]NMN57450.1 NAD(P)-dependent dehydrogenase (short-subunit alcohol dehydrogenase family) [Xanthobacter sp. SG618]